MISLAGLLVITTFMSLKAKYSLTLHVISYLFNINNKRNTKSMNDKGEKWDIIIKPKSKNFELNLKEVWQYRDLMMLYVKRDIVTMYKQTILGPIWYLIQPVMTTIMYMFVFGGIAGIPTDGIPQPLFYMAGILCWQYFGECLGRASGTFTGNAGVFSKVYFPRLVVPYSGIISSLVKFGIQLLLIVSFYIYYIYQGVDISPNRFLLAFPLLVIMLAGIGMGTGIIISSMTTKYRDLAFFFGFVAQLWMYATPVIYPLSEVYTKLNEKGLSAYTWVIDLNPLTPIVEACRYAFFGAGTFSWQTLTYSFAFTIVVMIVGSWIFNKVERRFIDVV